MHSQHNARPFGLNDDEIETLALKHIAPGYDRLRAIVGECAPYQHSDQFQRIKALLTEAASKLRAEGDPVAWRVTWTKPAPGSSAWRDAREVASPDTAELLTNGYSLELAYAMPQGSEAAQLLRKVHEDGYLSDTMNHRIARFFAGQPQASEAVRKLPKGWHYALNVAIDALEHETPTGEGWPDNWPAIVQDLNGLRDALTQPPAEKAGAACACPSGDGSLRWPCAAHPAKGPEAGDA